MYRLVYTQDARVTLSIFIVFVRERICQAYERNVLGFPPRRPLDDVVNDYYCSILSQVINKLKPSTTLGVFVILITMPRAMAHYVASTMVGKRLVQFQLRRQAACLL